MIFFKRFLFNRVFICYLTISFLTLSFASNASSMFIPSTQREADLQKIQKVLELKLVQHKLSQLGFSKAEIQERIQQLNAEDVHQIASQIRALGLGGDTGPWAGTPVYDVLVGILIALVVMLIVTLIDWTVKHQKEKKEVNNHLEEEEEEIGDVDEQD